MLSKTCYFANTKIDESFRFAKIQRTFFGRNRNRTGVESVRKRIFGSGGVVSKLFFDYIENRAAHGTRTAGHDWQCGPAEHDEQYGPAEMTLCIVISHRNFATSLRIPIDRRKNDRPRDTTGLEIRPASYPLNTLLSRNRRQYPCHRAHPPPRAPFPRKICAFRQKIVSLADKPGLSL